ncbi:MAG TPA: TonB family protein [Candidatus Rubrimentiphilum sp.]|nr:TonB family protein [Candidatus Rubrimentiphilum sp.]
MGALRNRRTLLAALAISLIVHATIALFVHVRPLAAEKYSQPLVILHLYVHPKPTPRPHRPVRHVSFNPIKDVRPVNRPPHVQPAPHGAVVTVPSAERTGEPIAPGNTGTPNTGGTVNQPESTATPKPACSSPDVEAKTVVAISPDTPDDSSGLSDAVAMIKVDLDEQGHVTNVSVYKSTGSLELDRTAMAAARQSSYTPEERDCKAVSGSYLFKVEFSQ